MVKISIIIPVLNEEKNLTRLLESLIISTDETYEVIVVDGGSNDNSLFIAHQHIPSVIVSQPGRGLQMNNGAAIAKGEVLLFLHADTQLPTDGLSQLQKLSINEDGFWGRYDVRLSGERVIFRLIESLINLRSRLTSIATGDQAIFVSRNLFERVGGFQEIALMEDIALSKTLKRYSKPYCLKDRVVTSSRRWQKYGVVRTILLMWKLRLYYFFGVSPDTLKRLYQ